MSDSEQEQVAPEGDGPQGEVRKSPRWAEAALAAAAVAVALATGVFFYGPLPVTVDGSLMVVSRSTTTALLVQQGLFAEMRGDLVSIHGRLLEARAGGAPRVRVNGSPHGPSVALYPGARLTGARGDDVVEATVDRSVETTPAVRYLGTGPVESVEDSGSPAIVRVVVGAVSGEEVTRTPISAGSPMTVRREPAWAEPKQVALTFDDGPWRHTTDEILRQLTAADAKATFFVIGNRLHGGGAAIEKRVVAAGMEIGNHSLSHRLLGRAPRTTVKRQILKGSQAITRALGVRPRWFRPPGGSTSATVRKVSGRYGLRVAMWTIDPKDWKRPPARVIARHILDRVRPGSVILMHDGGGDRASTVEALEAVIRGLKARGYSMVTLSRLHGLPEALGTPGTPEAPRWSDVSVLGL